MPLGESGGRSAGNRTGEGARRRNTPRERAQIDPPWDQKVPRFQLTERGERLADFIVWTSWFGFLFIMTLVLGEWWGFWNVL